MRLLKRNLGRLARSPEILGTTADGGLWPYSVLSSTVRVRRSERRAIFVAPGSREHSARDVRAEQQVAKRRREKLDDASLRLVPLRLGGVS